MKNLELLKNVGLSDQEIIVYTAIIKHGPSTAAQISENTNIHRTNVYNILIKLKNKGFIGEFKERNIVFFKVTDPKNILDFIKETEKSIMDVLPELNQHYNLQAEPVDVEIFRGPEGMKTIYNHIIREGKPVCAYGLTGSLRKKMPVFAVQWIRQMEEKNVGARYVYVEGITKPWRNIKVKYLPKEYLNPVATEIYGDYVVIRIWEPTLIAIRIHSKEVAKAYMKYFELIWAIAKDSTFAFSTVK